MKLTVHVDGGSRGNPGPAAAGAVASNADGEVLGERGEMIGEATNNVAEYRAVLLGAALALELGATEIELINDSELIAYQLSGKYKVKHADMKPLYAEAIVALGRFDSWSISCVRREQNEHADLLVNQTLDAGAL
ncbi:MAG: reverse transcriptase-like protein [Solirubrobacteraceae bacterium]|nr:reverse transcriptase-like protein [Solirubrobacteraceae bacterium]